MWLSRITENALEEQTKTNTKLKTLCLTLNTKLKHISVHAWKQNNSIAKILQIGENAM